MTTTVVGLEHSLQPEPLVLAAEYVRMSTDKQDLSIDIQKECIRAYASAHGWTLVKSYEDPGRSGLTLAGRPAMQQLLKDVMTRPPPFRYLLVYDVSRWGRFQNTDASAYHEYHCQLHGVEVVYVAELFARDPSPMGAVVKSLKRAMAAEYSRELSVKCRAGQLRSISLGYEMGTLPCLGFRRIAERKDGTSSRSLEEGDRTNVALERTRWILGPPHEIAMVQRVFRMYADPAATLQSVSRQLGEENVMSRNGKPLTMAMVRSLLGCEAFIGNFVWGRYTRATGERRGRRAADYFSVSGTVDPIVGRELWNAVQRKFALRHWDRRSPNQLLEELRTALKRSPLLVSDELGGYGCATRKVYERAFGSMVEAFRLAGRNATESKDQAREGRRSSRQLSVQIICDICQLLRSHGIACEKAARRQLIVLNGDVRVRLQLSWQQHTRTGRRWAVNKCAGRETDFILIARMMDDLKAIDFFLVPAGLYARFPAHTCEADRPRIGHRVDSALHMVEAFRDAIDVASHRVACGSPDEVRIG